MKKFVVITIVVILAAAATITGLELTNTTHIFHGKPAANTIVTAGRQLPAGQSNSSPNSSTHTSNTGSPSVTSSDGFATNNNSRGQQSSTTNSSQWITSASGVITVKQPSANATLSSGATLSGSTTSAGPIHFVLLDNTTGQIAQGMLNVTNGDFSGQINFSAQSANGQLNVFTTTPDGREQNIIQIGVNFRQ